MKREFHRNLIGHDFYCRIHIIPIILRPLRERKEDLPLLIEHFMSRFCGQKPKDPLPARMMEIMYQYHWPGNVRELQSVIKRTLTMGRFDPEFLEQPARPEPVSDMVCAGIEKADAVPAGSLKQVTEAFEKQCIVKTLQANRWRRMVSAKALGIHRKTLHLKMLNYGLY